MRTALRVPAAAPEERPFPEPLRLRLRRQVLALDYAGCSKLLCRLLEELGYEQVRPAGRTSLRGYNRRGGGGWDLAATLPAGVGSRRTIIRLKHSPRQHSGPEPIPVHQRCVDELRGACLRAGAAEGLLVSTGAFSLTARRLTVRDQSGVAPVRLVDGEELLDLLLAKRLGVREACVFPGRKRLEVDEGFFNVLSGGGASQAPAVPPPRTEVPTYLSSWRVTVRLIGLRSDAENTKRTGGR